MASILKMMFPAIAVLLLISCAPKLMPHQAVSQPPSRNEIVQAELDGKEVSMIVSRAERGDYKAIIFSEPFIRGEFDKVVESGQWQEKFESIRQDKAWLLFELSCGGGTCEATFHYREKGGQMVADQWWFNKYRPKLPKAEIQKWISESLKEKGLNMDWKY